MDQSNHIQLWSLLIADLDDWMLAWQTIDGSSTSRPRQDMPRPPKSTSKRQSVMHPTVVPTRYRYESIASTHGRDMHQ